MAVERTPSIGAVPWRLIRSAIPFAAIPFAAIPFATILIGFSSSAQIARNPNPNQLFLMGPPGLAAPQASSESSSYLTDPKIRRRLAEAERLIAEGSPARAFSVLQLILDDPEDSFVNTQSGEWISARRAAEQEVIRLGPTGWANYRLQYESQAASLLKQADLAGDALAWSQVVRRFFLTESGLAASNRLISHQLDRGRPGLALFYLDRLLECEVHRDHVTDVMRVKRVLALALLGREKDAAAAFAGIGAPTIKLGNAEVGLKQLLEVAAIHGSEPNQESGWRVVGGSARRTLQAEGSLPLLAADWTSPLVARTESSTQSLLADILMLGAQGRQQAPTFLALAPLGVGNVLIFRDLERTSAWELPSGKLRWTHEDGRGMRKQLLSGPRYGSFGNGMLVHSSYLGNSVYGSISSDGARVYQIDDLILNPNPYMARVINQKPNPELEQRMRNTLTALDIETGKRAWKRGGIDPADARNPTNDDTFYFGPPLPVDDDLFVLGETRSELRLFCLNPATGKQRWSQVVALCARRVDSDLMRRTEALHLAYSEGVLVIPTNLYRLTAIDPLTRTLLWNYAFLEDNPMPGQFAEVASYPATRQRGWALDPPMIARGRVVFSATQGTRIHAVDLQTGRRLWRIDRQGAFNVAGIVDDHVLLVAADHVRAVRLEDGQQVWRTSTPFPTGRSLVTATELLLPSTGEILALRISDGAIRGRVKARQSTALGNLLAFQGRLYSAGPAGLEAFPFLDDVEREIDRRLAERTDDPVGLYRRAQVRLTSGEVLAAVDDLLRVVRPSKEETAEGRQLLFDVAAREAMAHPSQMGPLVDRVQELAKSNEEKCVVLRLRAERSLALGDLPAAQQALFKHADLAEFAWLTTSKEDVERSPRAWQRSIGRRLLNHPRASEARIMEGLEERLRQADEQGDVATLESIAFDFDGFPLAARADLLVGRWLLKKDRLAEGEAHGWRAAQGSDDTIAASAWVLIAECCIKGDRLPDADYCWRQAARRSSGSRLSDGRTIGVAAQEFIARKVFSNAPEWKFDEVSVTLEHSQRPDVGRRMFVAASHQPPFLEDVQPTLDMRSSIEFLDRRTGKKRWSLLLPSPRVFFGMCRLEQVGHLAIVSMGDMLYAVSTLERRLLWSRLLSDQRPSPLAYPSVNNVSIGSNGSALVAVGASFLAVRADKDLLVLDPLTKREIWRKRGIANEQEILADDDFLFVVSRDGRYQAYRTRDGEWLRDGAWKNILSSRRDQAIELGATRPPLGRRVLLVGYQKGNWTVRLWDPWSEADVWTRSFPNNTRVYTGSEGEVIACEPGGAVSIIDPLTGETILSDQFGSEIGPSLIRVHYFHDSQSRYIAIDQRPAGAQFFFVPISNTMTRSINGTVRCYDRSNGKVRWSRRLQGRFAITSPGEELPVLLYVGTRFEQRRVNRQPVLSLEVIDKKDGTTRLEKDFSDYVQIAEVAHDSAEKWIELRSWNQRMRLTLLTKEDIEKRKAQGKSAPTTGAEGSKKSPGPASERLRRKLVPSVVPPPPKQAAPAKPS